MGAVAPQQGVEEGGEGLGLAVHRAHAADWLHGVVGVEHLLQPVGRLQALQGLHLSAKHFDSYFSIFSNMLILSQDCYQDC